MPGTAQEEGILAPFETDIHREYRGAFRRFLELEVVPYYEQWEEAGQVPKELWRKAGANGFVCPWVPEEYGGSGGDFIFSCILIEELARVRAPGWFLSLHNDIIVPYVYHYGTYEQKKRWLPKLCSGEYIASIAMTEPDAGSDLKAVRTTAVKENGHYRLNGQKTFISNGQISNFCIVVVKTNPHAGEQGISLIVVEGEPEGWVRGRNLKKLGLKAQDTSEMFFEDCIVPAENLLGREGRGFLYLMSQLQKERMVLALASVFGAKIVLDYTIQYVKERKAFGKRIADFQNTQFVLAELYTKYELAACFIQKLIRYEVEGRKNYRKEASMAKYYCTELQCEIADRCLQLFGGYGYMMEYPIARDFVDSRVGPIYAGTNEIMKLLIAKSIGL